MIYMVLNCTIVINVFSSDKSRFYGVFSPSVCLSGNLGTKPC